MEALSQALPDMVVDHDPDGQDIAIRKIVRILQAAKRVESGLEDAGETASRRHIVEALDTYKAAVTELVLTGAINLAQGEELNEIVERIVAEETT